MTARHAARNPAIRADWSAIERCRVDQERAARAVVVLAQTDGLPASRELYRRLLAAGALTPAPTDSIPAAALINRHPVPERRWAS